MKMLNKTILMYMLTTSTALLSYELFFSNFTDKFLVIASKKRAGIVEKYYQIAPPGGSVIQVWDDANCLESLQWAELNQSLPLHGGRDLMDPKSGYQIPRDKQDTFRKTFTNVNNTGKNLYLWNDLKIVMVPNDIFAKTVEAATQLVHGFDAIVCQSVDTLTLNAQQKTNKAQVKLNPSKNQHDCFFNLAQIAEAAGKISGISICKNRSFAILDTGKEDELTGEPLLIAETGEGE